MSVALVTGATAGIGAAFARRLARDGTHLVLLARDGDRLDATAAELRAEHGVTVETVVADLSTEDGLAVAEQRAAQGVDLLVNNAGFGHQGWFLDAPLDVELKTMRVHCEAVLRLTYAALPHMLQHGAGGVINVASIAAFVARGTYGASKAWVVSFSESVAAEIVGSGVRITTVCPGWVRTEFHDRAHLDVDNVPPYLWLKPETVVDAALRDFSRGRLVSIPTARYKAIVGLNRAVPRRLAAAISARVGSRRTGHRARRGPLLTPDV
ncbi:SDR family NAD(P)-dependent oxidoreductase [Micromonospora endophytica]|uniref:Short-chain dehydrogenase n=1 Tax=Micromonospora endophytica TaxID=515350 RepID=A0A2W2DKI8_9ACTN|nr:SDR family oxidoreductase [Micromonospora endophytica]PZF97686.1 short-chain dehydrogenase [Micromonospora endophytica]RIW51493.1 SDR family oxidoreductase [Micromonospora endophytica]